MACTNVPTSFYVFIILMRNLSFKHHPHFAFTNNNPNTSVSTKTTRFGRTCAVKQNEHEHNTFHTV